MVGLRPRVLHELVDPLVHVVVVPVRVVVDLVAVSVEAEPRRVAAAARAVQVAREDLRRRAERLRALPDPLEAVVALLLVEAHRAVLPVHPPPEEALEAGLGAEQPRLRVRVAKRVDLPRRAWRGVGAEVLEDELVAARGLVHHRRPQRRRLVVHAPRAVGELELLVLDELRRGRALLVARLLPPAREEAGLDVDEAAVWVRRQVLHHRVDDEVHLVGKVLVDGHLPARVVVAVGDQMHVDLAGDGTGAGVVLAVSGERVGRLAASLNRLVLPQLDRGHLVAQVAMRRDGDLLLGQIRENIAVHVVGAIGRNERRRGEEQGA